MAQIDVAKQPLWKRSVFPCLGLFLQQNQRGCVISKTRALSHELLSHEHRNRTIELTGWLASLALRHFGPSLLFLHSWGSEREAKVSLNTCRGATPANNSFGLT